MVDISIILPCQNEELALEKCLVDCKKYLNKTKYSYEIIVSDSSTDSSPKIAKKHRAVLVKHDKDGYGTAYMEGVHVSKGRYLIFLDADYTYDFSYIPLFVKELENGADFVIGNRFSGKMEVGAMPFLNKYLGNPVLSFLTRLLFQTKVADVHCGMRGITRTFFDRLDLHTTGMEFATEMVVKSIRQKGVLKEIPISYRKRLGESKLRPLNDAWRHIRFMLLYSPFYVFFLPALLFLGIGLSSFIGIYTGFFGLNIHPLFLSSLCIITGVQLLFLGFFAKTYAVVHLKQQSVFLQKVYTFFRLERLLVLGFFGILLSCAIFLFVFYSWAQSGFGELSMVKEVLLGATLCIVSIQSIFSGFMVSIIGIESR